MSGHFRVDGVSVLGGLTPEQEDAVSVLSLSGGKLLSAAPIVETLASVADWSTQPTSWIPLSPPAGSALDRDTSVVFASGGCTLKADVYTQFLTGPNEGCMPAGVRHPIDPRIDALDMTAVFDSFSVSGLANYGAYVGVTILSGIDGYGGFASARVVYTKAAGGTAGNPYWKAIKAFRAPNRSAMLEGDFTLVQAADGDPGAQTLRLVLTRDLRVFRAYINGAEMGGGSVASGEVDWTRGELNAAQRTTIPGPLSVLLEFGTNGNSSPASSARLTGFTAA